MEFFLVVILVALILLGCLMDSLSMILLAIPFFWPVLVEINGGLYQMAEGSGFGMSTEELKIWFGILALIVVELGLITPPVKSSKITRTLGSNRSGTGASATSRAISFCVASGVC